MCCRGQSVYCGIEIKGDKPETIVEGAVEILPNKICTGIRLQDPLIS